MNGGYSGVLKALKKNHNWAWRSMLGGKRKFTESDFAAIEALYRQHFPDVGYANRFNQCFNTF